MTVIVTAVAVLLANLASVWIAHWWLNRQSPPMEPPQMVRRAVYHACLRVGIAKEDFLAPGFNLVPTGQVYAVLHHAAQLLKKDHRLRTVDDLVTYLGKTDPLPSLETRQPVDTSAPLTDTERAS